MPVPIALLDCTRRKSAGALMRTAGGGGAKMPDFLLIDMLVRIEEALETRFLPSNIMRDGRVDARRGWMGESGRSSCTTRRMGGTR